MSKKAHLVAALGLALCGAATGCGSSHDAAQNSEQTQGSDQSGAQRAIEEADIIQLDGDRLYTMSAVGTVSIVDVSLPGRLALRGQRSLGGTPFEMYRRGELLLTMWNGAYTQSGQPVPPPSPSAPAANRSAIARDSTSGAAVVVLDMRDLSGTQPLATLPVPGEIADSRIVGDVLYVATYENSTCYNCATTPRTTVTSFDIKDPTAMRKVDQVTFTSSAPNSYGLAWGTDSWKRSIFVTTERLYIGGHSDIDPQELSNGQKIYNEGIVDVLDITDPSGRMKLGARLEVPGAILSRWQLDERNGVLRVISQRGAGRTQNGLAMPQVATYRVDSAQQLTPLGSTNINLPRQEGLRTVRFDDQRAYAITYAQSDPLFTIDLTDPTNPMVRGELHMPGYMFYLEPRGDRLLGLGIDNTDPYGSLNVSLIDVSNLAQPRLMNRVPFGSSNVGTNYTIVNFELPEDQDRIQKAFRVFDDGLVSVPFTYANSNTYYNGQGDSCEQVQGGVQLLDWSTGNLVRGALLSMRGNPRRAFEKDGELLAVSDSNVTSFSMASRSMPTRDADVEIGPCTPKYGPEYWEGGFEGDDTFHFPFGCSATATRPAGSTGVWLFAALGLLTFARGARRRRAE